MWHDFLQTYGNLTQSKIWKMTIPRKDFGPERQHIRVYENCYQYDIDFETVYPADKPWTWPKHPPRGNESWPKIKCQSGWDYDKSEYKDSLVTEVRC